MWLGVAFAVLVGVYIWKRFSSYSSKLPPGPLNIPLIGSWEFLKLYVRNGSLVEMSSRLGEKYGPVVFMRIAMDTPLVIIRTYEVIKAASRNTLLAGMNMPFLYRMANDWKNQGISFADGRNWRNNRKFAMNWLGKLGFSGTRAETLINYECAQAVESLLAAKGKPVDVEKDLVVTTANSIFQIMMSQRFDASDPRFVKMKQNASTLFDIIAKIQTRFDFLPWMSHVAGENSDYKTLEKILGRIYEFVDKVIQEHQQELDKDNPQDLIDAYLCLNPEKMEGQDLSVDNLRVMMKDLIIGGMDPPSIVLSWILMLVATDHDIQAKVCAEIDAVIGRDRAPRIEDENACPYIRAVIDETFRYVSLTPFNRHFTSQGATTLLGYHIPANSVIMLDLHSIHFDQAVWGDPAAFRPERFLSAEGGRLRERVHTFGLSPRVCPAEAYARVLLFLFTAGLFQRLTFRLPDGGRVAASAAYSVGVRPAQPFLIAEPR